MNQRKNAVAGTAKRRRAGAEVASQYLQIVDELRLRDLQFICEIASAKSLTKAAERFNLTQPAASRLLAQIEEGLQTTLFDRSKAKGMSATPAGVLTVGRAHAVLADLNTLAGELIALKSGAKGELRLGSIFFVSTQLLRDLITELTAAPSDLWVSLQESDSVSLVELLRDESLDVAIMRCYSKSISTEFYQQPIYRQSACLVAHPQSVLVKPRAMSLEQLRNHSWVLPPFGSPTREAFESAFLQQQLPAPQPLLETASSKLIHSLVSAVPGMVALVPSEVGRELEGMGDVVSLPLPVPLELPPIGFVCLRRHLNEPAISRTRSTLSSLVARGLPLS